MARKALCVGINQFKNYLNNGLNGCVNDVKDMASALTGFLGFTSADIVTLTDAQATKSSIMSNLTAMVQDAKAGKFDYLVFSLSSHGTQMPDTSGDESDKYDEAFCPHDLAAAGDHWDPQHIILDDELHDLFVQLPKAVLLEVYLDTCHSGTGLKAIDFLFDRKPRYLPPPSLKSFDLVDERAPRGFYKSFGKQATQQQILWAACKSNQTSADAHIGGTWHGAFTYFFCKELHASVRASGRSPLLTRAGLLKKVRADLKAARYTQTPQLECQATTRRTKVG